MSYGLGRNMMIVPGEVDLSASAADKLNMILPSTGAKKIVVEDVQLLMTEAVSAGDTGVCSVKYTASGGSEVTKGTYTLSTAKTLWSMVAPDDDITPFEVREGDTISFEHTTAASGAGKCYFVLFYRELP